MNNNESPDAVKVILIILGVIAVASLIYNGLHIQYGL